MKIDLSGNELDPRGYDRDNGEGTAERIIKAFRETGSVNPEEAELQHKENTLLAARKVRNNLWKETTIGSEGGVGIISLGLRDLAGPLTPKINDVLKDDAFGD